MTDFEPPAGTILDPNLPVAARSARHLPAEFLEDLNSGHNIRATVFVQCGAMLELCSGHITVIRLILRCS